MIKIYLNYLLRIFKPNLITIHFKIGKKIFYLIFYLIKKDYY